MKYISGMGAGLLAGMCIGMAMAPMKGSRSRQVRSAMKRVGQAIEEFGSSLF